MILRVSTPFASLPLGVIYRDGHSGIGFIISVLPVLSILVGAFAFIRLGPVAAGVQLDNLFNVDEFRLVHLRHGILHESQLSHSGLIPQHKYLAQYIYDTVVHTDRRRASKSLPNFSSITRYDINWDETI